MQSTDKTMMLSSWEVNFFEKAFTDSARFSLALDLHSLLFSFFYKSAKWTDISTRLLIFSVFLCL